MASDLPFEVLERIFSLPDLAEEPLLDAPHRVRCQLVCKAWQQGLSPSRWPLHALTVGTQDASAAPPAATWVLRTRPGVRCLTLILGDDAGFREQNQPALPLGFNFPAARALQAALLAVEPRSAVREISIVAPFPVLERLCSELHQFPALRQLSLVAQMDYVDDEEEGEALEWDTAAVLGPQLLRHLPPWLESLTADHFYSVQLVGQSVVGPAQEPGRSAAGLGQQADQSAAGPGQEQEPGRRAWDLPGLTELRVHMSYRMALDAALPSLACLTVGDTSKGCDLSGATLSLPSLTRLDVSNAYASRLRCAAMPALATLRLGVVAEADGFAGLQHLTRLVLDGGQPAIVSGTRVLRGGSPQSLRSVSVHLYPRWDGPLCQLAAQGLATMPQLTHLELNSLSCVAHLPAWPHLQELLLTDVHPTGVTPEQLAQLARAPSLLRLRFSYHVVGPIDKEAARREERARLAVRC